MKTLALMMEGVDPKTGKGSARAVVLLMRGDHQMNEAKLSAALGGKATRPMQEDEIRQLFNSPGGFLGPVGIAWAKDMKDVERPVLFVDKGLEGRTNLIGGANKEDYHFKNITPGRDFKPTASVDLRSVTAGEDCPNCGGTLRIDSAVEIGHIFKLGYKYSESMGARVLDKNGKEVTPIMGSYGIGIERILTAAVEQDNDENGFWLPPRIAPFEIVVTPTNVGDEKLLSTAMDIARRQNLADPDLKADGFSGSVGAIERAVTTARPVAVSDALIDPFLQGRESVIAGKIRALVCVPLVAADRMIGLIYADSAEPGAAFSELDVEILEALASHAALAIVMARVDRELRGMAAQLPYVAPVAPPPDSSWSGVLAHHRSRTGQES